METGMAGLAGLTLAQSAFANIIVPQKKERLGVALVGLGYYSTDLLAPALQLTKPMQPGRHWLQAHHPKQRNGSRCITFPIRIFINYQNFDSIANNPDIDVIYIVLPPSMHADYSIRAAKAGKHVWCEKPMAPSVADCKNMIGRVFEEQSETEYWIPFASRTKYKKDHTIQKDLAYGKIVKVEASAGYFDARTDHWKQKKSMGGGVMGDMGVYPLNATRYSVGLEPIAVTAVASTTRPEIYKEVEETMNFELEFPGGATATCVASFGKGMTIFK
jgi:glucose-fructose oxidoreductase